MMLVTVMNVLCPRACDGVPDPEEHRRCIAATEAVARYRETSRLAWRDWTKITGPALLICREAARRRARDEGGRYEDHMGQLLRFYHLDILDKSDRSPLIRIMENLDEVEAWRDLQPDKDDLNNPQVVWHNFRAKSSRGKDERTKEKLGDIAILIKRIEELETELKKSHARIDTLEWELAGSKQQGKRRGA